MNNALLKELTDIDFKKILELIDKKEIPDNFDNLKDNVYRFNLDEITQKFDPMVVELLISGMTIEDAKKTVGETSTPNESA